MHKHDLLPMSDEYSKKLRDKAKEEWLTTQLGQQYNVKYEQLWGELHRVCADMDSHIQQHMIAKYGHI